MGTLPLVAAFLIINYYFDHDGQTNPAARLATLVSMTERQTFWIDGYQNYTSDWSQIPNGHYYSNKAPGPMLIGYPIFGLITYFEIPRKPSVERQGEEYFSYRNETLFYLSFLLQVIPFALVALWMSRLMKREGLAERGIVFGLAALLFGTTPSLLMNTYFGHGMTAVFCVACLLAALDKKTFWSAFCFGFALLCDYGAACLLPGFLWLWFRETGKSFKKNALTVFAGAVLPGALWVWYHTASFGSPFTLPNQYINPIFRNLYDDAPKLWGLLYPMPKFSILFELLFGLRRGLLITQPWVLVVLVEILLALGVRKRWPSLARPKEKGLVFCLLTGFGFLLIMNSSFSGWDGGSTIGPRYLSPVLPFFAIAAAYFYREFSQWGRKLLWAGLLVSLGLYVLITPVGISSPPMALWKFFIQRVRDPEYGQYKEVAFLTTLLGLALLWALRKHAKTSVPA